MIRNIWPFRAHTARATAQLTRAAEVAMAVEVHKLATEQLRETLRRMDQRRELSAPLVLRNAIAIRR